MVSLSAAEVVALPGVAPLPASVVSALPASTPGPPWNCRVEALLWWHRAVPAAGSFALSGLGSAFSDRRLVWVTVGAFVRYLDSPVGTYSEVFASPVLVAGRFGGPAVTVPFIAVDSVPSIQGGREHWGLPKVPASFAFPSLSSGSSSGSSSAAVSAEGEGWSVSGAFTGRVPALPFAGILPTLQPQLDGTVAAGRVFQRGLGRLGRLKVSVTGAALSPWLLAGNHRCLAITRARMAVGPAR